MPNSLTDADLAKRAAAEHALGQVADGMTVGLGTGSTAAWFVRLLSERISADGLSVTGVATSSTTTWLARDLGVPLKDLDEVSRIDVTVDGADEVDVDLRLVKGGGGALLQEKIVAFASERLLIVADDSKMVAQLGAFPLPVEVVRFGWQTTLGSVRERVAELGHRGVRIEPRRSDGELLVTDEGHYILDLHLERIGDPESLAAVLSSLPGVVEHGLFIGMASEVIVGRSDGVEVRHRPPRIDVAEAMRSEDA